MKDAATASQGICRIELSVMAYLMNRKISLSVEWPLSNGEEDTVSLSNVAIHKCLSVHAWVYVKDHSD